MYVRVYVCLLTCSGYTLVEVSFPSVILQDVYEVYIVNITVTCCSSIIVYKIHELEVGYVVSAAGNTQMTQLVVPVTPVVPLVVAADGWAPAAGAAVDAFVGAEAGA